MGLDMYLSAKLYTCKYTHEALNNDIRSIPSLIETMPPISHNLQSVEIKVEVAYWRKANQIHDWFVKTVQNNVDDCGEYYVSIDQMKQLVQTCKDLLETRDGNKAMELLPTKSGFSLAAPNTMNTIGAIYKIR